MDGAFFCIFRIFLGYAAFMKLLVYLLLSFTLACPVTAEIYKSLDDEGGVTYSDKETPRAKKIPTPSPNTIQMPKATPRQTVEQPDKTAGYSHFRITSPTDNTTIRSSLGTLSVSLAIEPALNIEQGHSISILLDGRPVIASTRQLNIELNNIDRGSHSLKARVRDKQGKSIISSNSIRFHLKRLSSQHSEPSGTPPGPGQSDGTSYTPGPSGTYFTPGPVPPPAEP